MKCTKRSLVSALWWNKIYIFSISWYSILFQFRSVSSTKIFHYPILTLDSLDYKYFLLKKHIQKPFLHCIYVNVTIFHCIWLFVFSRQSILCPPFCGQRETDTSQFLQLPDEGREATRHSGCQTNQINHHSLYIKLHIFFDKLRTNQTCKIVRSFWQARVLH